MLNSDFTEIKASFQRITTMVMQTNIKVTSRTTANCPALFEDIPSSLVCGSKIIHEIRTQYIKQKRKN